jgi:hypothetical protein
MITSVVFVMVEVEVAIDLTCFLVEVVATVAEILVDFRDDMYKDLFKMNRGTMTRRGIIQHDEKKHRVKQLEN